MDIRIVMNTLCGALLILAVGCNAVYVSEPVGPAAKVLEETEWKGTLVAQGEYGGQIFVGDAAKGEVVLAGAEKDQNGELKLETWKIYLRPAGDDSRWFVTAENHDEKSSATQKLAFVGVLKMPEEKEKFAILWPADPERFVQFIGEGKLPGKSQDNDAYLGKLDAQHFDLITSPSTMLLQWDKPGVLEIVPAAK